MDDDRPFKISLIEMDAKHERYGEIEITDYYTTIKLNIPAYGTLPTMPRYEAFLGAYDAIRLGNLLIRAACAILIGRRFRSRRPQRRRMNEPNQVSITATPATGDPSASSPAVGWLSAAVIPMVACTFGISSARCVAQAGEQQSHC